MSVYFCHIPNNNGCTNDSKTVFLSAHINILPNSQSLKSNCQNYSHCTFASRKNGSTPVAAQNIFSAKYKEAVNMSTITTLSK